LWLPYRKVEFPRGVGADDAHTMQLGSDRWSNARNARKRNSRIASASLVGTIVVFRFSKSKRTTDPSALVDKGRAVVATPARPLLC
jgi:hypothetical protein